MAPITPLYGGTVIFWPSTPAKAALAQANGVDHPIIYTEENFVDRVRANDAKKRDAKSKGVKVSTKRVPQQPRAAHVVDCHKTSIEYMNPILHRELY